MIRKKIQLFRPYVYRLFHPLWVPTRAANAKNKHRYKGRFAYDDIDEDNENTII